MISLRARLAILLVLAAFGVAALVGTITYNETLKQNKKLFDYQIRQAALSLRDQGMPDRWLLESGQEKPDMVAQIWSADGKTIYISHAADSLPGRAPPGYGHVDAAGLRWRTYSMAANGRTIQVSQPLQVRRNLAAESALRSLSPLLAFAPLMALLIWLMLSHEFRSLKRLEREVQAINSKSLRRVSEKGLPSEIAPVARAVNSLLDRLERAMSAQRGFVGDAAHELRSPITALKLQLHAFESAQSPGQRKAALLQLHHGVDRACRLIEQLLTAARTDPEEPAITLKPVDIAEALRRVIAEAYFNAQAREIAVDLDSPEQAIVAGDFALLQVMLRNLIDNAIRYNVTGGRVLASVTAERSGVRVMIQDSGPGIAPAERQRVFRRFHRGASHGEPGNGLGLAIVRNIALRHQARIELGESKLGGLEAMLVFPPASLAENPVPAVGAMRAGDAATRRTAREGLA